MAWQATEKKFPTAFLDNWINMSELDRFDHCFNAVYENLAWKYFLLKPRLVLYKYVQTLLEF